MAHSFSAHTAALCLAEIEKLCGKGTWQHSNKRQEQFLRMVYPRIVDDFPFLPELIGKAAYTAEEINAFLRQKGFDIRLQPWENNGQNIGVAGVMDTKIRWQTPGKVTDISGAPISVAGKSAFRLLGDENPIGFHVVRGLEEPMISIRTADNETVFLVHFLPTMDSDELVLAAQSLMDVGRRNDRLRSGYDGVEVPNVFFDVQPDISWFVGMMHTSPAIITQAKQQVRFGMNKDGARAMQASTMGATRGFAPKKHYYQVKPPFLVIIDKSHTNFLEFPVFASVVEVEDCKDPGNFVPAHPPST